MGGVGTLFNPVQEGNDGFVVLFPWGSAWETMGQPPLPVSLCCGSAKPHARRPGLRVELGVQPSLEKVFCWLSLSLNPFEEGQAHRPRGCSGG